MDVSALVMELMSQLDKDGILNEGSLDIDLNLVDPETHTGIIQIAFHVDVHVDGARRPHAEGLKLVIYEPYEIIQSPEQFPTGFRPKGVG